MPLGCCDGWPGYGIWPNMLLPEFVVTAYAKVHRTAVFRPKTAKNPFRTPDFLYYAAIEVAKVDRNQKKDRAD